MSVQASVETASGFVSIITIIIITKHGAGVWGAEILRRSGTDSSSMVDKLYMDIILSPVTFFPVLFLPIL